jgi:non-heme chloroperoxidase
MGMFKTEDGTHLYYRDWGKGPPIVFSHGWPLSGDAWEEQMMFFADKGYRCIAHDRRGHGRSGQPWEGNDMNTYSDDLGALLTQLDVKDAVLVGHSTGGGEVAHYMGRHGTGRVKKVVFVDAVTPFLLKTPSNPDGAPMEVFDGMRSGLRADVAQFWRDLSAPFFGANRPKAKVSQGLMDWFWLEGMMAGFKAVYDCVKAFSETDMTGDVGKIDVPTLVIHGTDDQIVPIVMGRKTAKLVKNAQLKEYGGAPHGLFATHKEQLNQDLLSFIKS